MATIIPTDDVPPSSADPTTSARQTLPHTKPQTDPTAHHLLTTNATETELANKAILALSQKKGLSLINKSKLRTLADKAKNVVDELHNDPNYKPLEKVETVEEETESDEESKEESVYSMSDSDAENPQGDEASDEEAARKAREASRAAPAGRSASAPASAALAVVAAC